MSVYYSENDPFAVAWLRALIHAGVLPDGEVDDRSITAVRPADVAGFTHCHLFAGIGGWPLALKLAGWDDARPVWTGSCPCQPWSQIGRGRGTADSRHLWPEFRRLVLACRPPDVFGEQVAGAAGLHWLAGVRSDLVAAGYALGAADLPAASVGAPHRRQRLYWVAHTRRTGLEGFTGDGDRGDEPRWLDPPTHRPAPATGASRVDAPGVDAVPVLRRLDLHAAREARVRVPVPADRPVDQRPLWAECEAVACADGWRRTQPGLFPLAHGVSARVGRLRAIGNAVVPHVAAAFIDAYLSLER